MNRFDRAFGAAAGRVQSAAIKTLNDFARSNLPDEPNFTTALVTRIHDNLAGFARGGVSWEARILSPRHEEKRVGADFVGILRLNLPGYSVAKAFLAQAKRQEPGFPLAPSHWSALVDQCKKMCERSPESYVLVYARNGVVVVPAVGVLACSEHQDLHLLHPVGVKAFFKRHFECWVGQRLDAPESAAPWLSVDELPAKGIELIGSANVEDGA